MIWKSERLKVEGLGWKFMLFKGTNLHFTLKFINCEKAKKWKTLRFLRHRLFFALTIPKTDLPLEINTLDFSLISSFSYSVFSLSKTLEIISYLEEMVEMNRLIVSLTISFVVIASWSSISVRANSEGDALSALRRSLNDPDNVLQSWDPNLVNPCTWFHITCNQDNRVTRLYVSYDHFISLVCRVVLL